MKQLKNRADEDARMIHMSIQMGNEPPISLRRDLEHLMLLVSRSVGEGFVVVVVLNLFSVPLVFLESWKIVAKEFNTSVLFYFCNVFAINISPYFLLILCRLVNYIKKTLFIWSLLWSTGVPQSLCRLPRSWALTWE